MCSGSRLYATASRVALRWMSAYLISVATATMFGGIVRDPPGVYHSWLSTRTLPTQLPGSASTTGRKNVWIPAGRSSPPAS